MLKRLGKDQTVSPSTSFDAKGNAIVVFGVTPKEGLPTYEGNVTFDFAGVSAEQVKSLAVDGLTIKLQSRLRTAYKAKKDGGEPGMLKVGAPATIRVAEFITVRARVDKVEKAKKVASGMTAEQKKALIAELQKSMKA